MYRSNVLLNKIAGQTSGEQFLEVAELDHSARERVTNDLLELGQSLNDHIVGIFSQTKTIAIASRIGLTLGWAFDISCKTCMFGRTPSDGGSTCKPTRATRGVGTFMTGCHPIVEELDRLWMRSAQRKDMLSNPDEPTTKRELDCHWTRK